MTQPKVSICIPTYRQPQLFERAIISIDKQTYRDFEIVVTDDSGNDEIFSVVEKYRARLPIRYFKNAKALGSPENWNEAVRKANGELIKILHHDDWFPNEESLSKFVELLDKNPDCDFAFGGTHNIDAYGNLRSVHSIDGFGVAKIKAAPERLFQSNLIGAPSATIYRRKSAVEYDVRMKWLVDIDFYIRILLKNRNFAHTRSPLISVSVGAPTQVTAASANNKYVEIYEYLLLKHKLEELGAWRFSCFRTIWTLFDNYDIESISDIGSSEVADDSMQAEIGLILFFLKPFRRARRLLKYGKLALSPTIWLRTAFQLLSYILCKGFVKKEAIASSSTTKLERPI